MAARLVVLGLGLAGLMTSPALAQEQENAGQPVRIVITKVDCSRLIRHTPSADVAYQPGVDARGRAVAPADVPGSGADAMGKIVPDVLEFPITINPVSWGARNQAQRDKAAALQGSADTYANKNAAQAKIATLTTQKATLTSQATTLASEKTALAAALTSAQNNLATLQAQVNAGTLVPSDRSYVLAKAAVPSAQAALAAKQTQVDANTAQLAATTSAISTQQAIVDAAPGQDAQYTAAKNAADAKLATISAKGLDNTAMTVGTVRYDMAKGTFTFNGQPLGSPEQEELAHACARQGVR